MEASDPEVRAAAAATTEKTLYGKETVAEILKLLRDKSEDAKLTAFKGVATASNFRYAEAQDALVRIARSRNTPIAERVLAIDGLGKTAKLMLPGNFEDRLVIWTLVLILDDDDLKAREAAFATLEKGVKDTFEYKPDLPSAERKASVAKWHAWCTKVAGPPDHPAAAK
jgi:HEAT repeat protein